MSAGEVGAVWSPGNGCNFYVIMVPVENAEGPSLLKPKGRAAEAEGSDRAGGGPHSPWARGKARQPGRAGRVSHSCASVCVCVSTGACKVPGDKGAGSGGRSDEEL